MIPSLFPPHGVASKPSTVQSSSISQAYEHCAPIKTEVLRLDTALRYSERMAQKSGNRGHEADNTPRAPREGGPEDLADHASWGARAHALLGFPLTDTALRTAGEFIRAVFPENAKLRFRENDACLVLEKIIRAKIEDTKPEQVVIPLSSGWDSTSILGAVLRVYPLEKILCVTVGGPKNKEVLGARSICHALGLRHIRIEPSRYLWSMEKSVLTTRTAFLELGVYSPFEKALFDSMAESAEHGSLWFSGFFGDVVSGGHISSERTASTTRAINAFISWNATISRDSCDVFRPVIESELKKWKGQVGHLDYQGMTDFDLLDIGLRQGLRIQNVAHIAKERVYSPFLEPEWVHFWYSRPLSLRNNQKLYKSSIQKGFPEVFAALSNKRKSIFRRAQGVFKGSPTHNELTTERGSFAGNSSKMLLAEKLLGSFEERNISLPFNVGSLKTAIREMNGETSNLKVIKSVASLELNLRAGNYESSSWNTPDVSSSEAEKQARG